MKKIIFAGALIFIIALMFPNYGFCTDYTYEVQQARFHYDNGETYDRTVSGVTITLQDGSTTLPSVNIGRFKDLPEGTIDVVNLYLYRQEGDLWDRDGWSEWDFLNGQTIAASNDDMDDVTVKLQWNGVSYTVVDPTIEQ